MTTAIEVVEAARKLIGTPYQHQGRLPGIAVDCIGVPILVARELSLGDFEDLEYGRQPDDSLLPRIKQVCQPAVIQSGTILVLKFSRFSQHCGIAVYGDDKTYSIVHAWDVAGKVVEQKLAFWQNKIVGVFKFPGVDYPND